MTRTLSPQEALIYAMITTAATDNLLSDAELKRIGTIVKELPAFDGFDENTLVEHAQACGLLMSGSDGLENVLETIAVSLPEKNMLPNRHSTITSTPRVSPSDMV